MNKNKISINQFKFLLLVIVLSLFLFSCDSNTSSKEGVGNNIGNVKNTYAGKEGMVLEFKTSGQAKTIHDDNELNFIFLLKNKGRYSTDNVILVKPIFDKRYITDIFLREGEFSFGNTYTEVIKGKSLMGSGSEELLIIGTIKASKLSEIEDKRTENLIFNYCYRYETIFEDEFCVDTDVYDLSPEKKLCKSEKKSFSSGQGAPVEITVVDISYDEKNGKIIPTINLEVSNSGKGKVLTESGYNVFCLGNDVTGDSSLINLLTIKDISFSKLRKEDFKCDEIILKNNNAKFTCRLIDEEKGFTRGDGNFYGKFSLELSYGYQDMVGFDLTIEK